MKAVSTLVSITLLALNAVTVVEAGCYTSGHEGPLDTALYHLGRACKGYDGKQGAFQGWFAPGQIKSACVNEGKNRYDMQVQNRGSQGFDLGDQDCYNEFWLIASTCSAGTIKTIGGERTNAGWWFR